MDKKTKLSKQRFAVNIYLKTMVLVAALLLASLSFWSALTNLNDRSNTPMGFRFFVPDSNYLVAKGNQLILKNHVSAFDQLDASSKRVLQLSPLNIPALYQRSIWLKSAGMNAKALSTMSLAEKLSRRNKAVNFWFIQWNAEHGQIDKLLDHYDYALKTNKESSAALFPALAKALEIPEGREYFAKKVKQKPSWIYPALKFAIASNGDPSNVAETLFIANGLPHDEEARQVEDDLIGSLLAKSQMHLARRYYLSLSRSKPNILGSINFSIDSVDAKLAPLTWGGINSQNASGEFVNKRGSTKPVLIASAFENTRGLVARRVFFPEPGLYRMISDPVLNGSTKAQLFFALKCSIAGTVSEFYRAQVNSGRPMPLLKIDQGCDAVYFDIELDSGESQQSSQLELRSLTMERVK